MSCRTGCRRMLQAYLVVVCGRLSSRSFGGAPNTLPPEWGLRRWKVKVHYQMTRRKWDFEMKVEVGGVSCDILGLTWNGRRCKFYEILLWDYIETQILGWRIQWLHLAQSDTAFSKQLEADTNNGCSRVMHCWNAQLQAPMQYADVLMQPPL